MKHIASIVLLLAAFVVALMLCGCKLAPNSWNVTYYEPTGMEKSGRTIAVGVSGPLPFGNQ